MRYELTKRPTDPTVLAGQDLGSLQSRLSGLLPDEQFQLWMFRADGEMACVLANQSRAWVHILPAGEAADHESLALDPDFDGPAEAFEEIYLENGQLDELRRSHCIPRAEGIAAGLHYFQTGTKSPLVTWWTPSIHRSA